MKTLQELQQENELLQLQLDAAKKDNAEMLERNRLEKANAELRARIERLRAEVAADARRNKDPEQ